MTRRLKKRHACERALHGFKHLPLVYVGVCEEPQQATLVTRQGARREGKEDGADGIHEKKLRPHAPKQPSAVSWMPNPPAWLNQSTVH